MGDTVLALTFPAGKLRHIAIAATAGDVVTNLTPGLLKRWLVLFGIITLVCDGNAANRAIATNLTDGTNIILNIPTTTPAITAGQTRTLNYMRWLQTGGTGDNFHIALPDNCIIEGVDQLRITINNGLAGDSYSGNITVLEL